MTFFDQEVIRKAEKGLSEAIYHLTWAGMLWGRLGAIRLSRLRFDFLKALDAEATGLSALSSTYYTAAGNAGARAAQSAGVSRFIWWVGGAWCLLRAVVCSHRLERKVGLSGMSADQLDIRSRVLFKARRYEASLRCSREALRRQNLSLDSSTLLRFGMAETLDALGKTAEATQAYTEALHECDRVRPTTSVRVLRSWGVRLMRAGELSSGRDALRRALDIAREHKLHDQEVKIQALLEEVGQHGG